MQLRSYKLTLAFHHPPPVNIYIDISFNKVNIFVDKNLINVNIYVDKTRPSELSKKLWCNIFGKIGNKIFFCKTAERAIEEYNKIYEERKQEYFTDDFSMTAKYCRGDE